MYVYVYVYIYIYIYICSGAQLSRSKHPDIWESDPKPILNFH